MGYGDLLMDPRASIQVPDNRNLDLSNKPDIHKDFHQSVIESNGHLEIKT